MRLDKKFLTIIAVLLAVTHAGSAVMHAQKQTNAGRCAEAPLKEGPLAFGKSLRLGTLAEFDDKDGLSSGHCFPLYAGGTLAAWVIDVRQAGGRILVWRCMEDSSATDIKPGARGGYVADGYEEMTPTGGAFTFKEVNFPLWGHFSNPSFCGAAVAYWGTEPAPRGKTRVYAMLFDAGSMRLVGKRLAGTAYIESDSYDFFSPPAWQSSGAAASFAPDPQRALNLRRLILRRE